MALPASGTIAASDINVELGRSSTASISLATAATGGYATINTLSPSHPNASTPHSMSEWYSYNHTYVPPVPALTSATMLTVDPPSCGFNWKVACNYTISDPDDTLYKLSVYDAGGSSLLQDDVGMSASGTTPDYDTLENGDTSSFDRTVNAQFTLKIIRRSDSAVMDDLQSDLLQQNMSFAC